MWRTIVLKEIPVDLVVPVGIRSASSVVVTLLIDDELFLRRVECRRLPGVMDDVKRAGDVIGGRIACVM
jgi:hypothetical protein